MFFRKLVVGLVAVCACVGTAAATSNSVKVKNFQAIDAGMTANPHVDGMAMFKQEGGATTLHLHVEDLERNAWYGVALAPFDQQTIPVYSNDHAFQTNSGGVGTFDAPLSVSQDPGSDPVIYLYRTDLGPTNLCAVGWIDPSLSPTVKIQDFDPTGAGTS